MIFAQELATTGPGATGVLAFVFLAGSIANIVIGIRLNKQNRAAEGWQSAASAAAVERDAQRERAERKEQEHGDCERRLDAVLKRVSALEAKTDLGALETRMNQHFALIEEAMTSHFQSDATLQAEMLEHSRVACEGIKELLTR